MTSPPYASEQQQQHFFPAPQMPSGETDEDDEGGTPASAAAAVPRLCPSAQTCCVLELSAARLYRYRTYTVMLSLRRAWRCEHGLTELGVFDALLSARCCLLGTSTVASCARCKCARVVELSATSHAPAYRAATDVEVYACGIQSRCSSSRDHLKSALMLLVDGLPTPTPVLSPPFVLYARDKKTKAGTKAAPATVRPPAASTALLQQQQQEQPELAGVAEHTFSLFKRARCGDPAVVARAPAGANDPGAAEAFPETCALIAQHAARADGAVGSGAPPAPSVPDRTQLLPEAFVSSFLLNGRPSFSAGSSATVPPPQAPPQTAAGVAATETETETETGAGSRGTEGVGDGDGDGEDGLVAGLVPGESPMASYFDGPFSSYPRGVHAFTAFQLSPTLLDMPPYSTMYSMP